MEILEKRGYPLTVETVERGFEKAFIPARMELLSREPLCLLDGGHNPGCALALKNVLERFVPQRRTAVIGMLSDKDSREALRILGPLFSKIITIAPDNPRALPAEELAETAREFCPRRRPKPAGGSPGPVVSGLETGRCTCRVRFLLPVQ